MAMLITSQKLFNDDNMHWIQPLLVHNNNVNCEHKQTYVILEWLRGFLRKSFSNVSMYYDMPTCCHLIGRR